MDIHKITVSLAAALAIVLALHAPIAQADIVVVVSSKSSIESLSAKEVSNIFLGHVHMFPDGGAALPVDLREGTPEREQFYGKVAGKSMAMLKAHWSKLIFTGSGQPPREVATPAAIKKLIGGNNKYIGYMDEADVDATVKIILRVR